MCPLSVTMDSDRDLTTMHQLLNGLRKEAPSNIVKFLSSICVEAEEQDSCGSEINTVT